MAIGRLWAVAATTLGTTFLLATAPASAEAQERRPSIRIGGGHVHIGGRHVGFTGRGRDPHATGLLIRGHLHRLGDRRAHRFGPRRLRLPHPHGHGHKHFHPRHRRVFSRFHPHARGLLHHRHGHQHHHPGHHGGHLIVIAVHPLGSVALASRLGARVTPPRAGPPPERCADITVRMLAGVVQTVRLDVRSLGVDSVTEADQVLRARLASGGGLALRDTHGGGLSAPGSMVRGVMAEACPASRKPASP